MENILTIENLDITFRTNAGKIHAIRGVDLALPKGKTVALVGESGSGKSVPSPDFLTATASSTAAKFLAPKLEDM